MPKQFAKIGFCPGRRFHSPLERSMNGGTTDGDESWPERVGLCVAQSRLLEGSFEEMAIERCDDDFLWGTVVVVSAFIFVLSKRMGRRRAGWGPSRVPIVCSSADGGLSASSEGFGVASWFSGSDAFEPRRHTSTHQGDSCSAWDGGVGGSWDSGGGGDCRGGGVAEIGGAGDGGDNGERRRSVDLPQALGTRAVLI